MAIRNTSSAENPAARQADRFVKSICKSIYFLVPSILISFGITHYIFQDLNGECSYSFLFLSMFALVSMGIGAIWYMTSLYFKAKKFKERNTDTSKESNESLKEQSEEPGKPHEVKSIEVLSPSIDHAQLVVNTQIEVKNRLIGYFNFFLKDYFSGDNAQAFAHNMEIIANHGDIENLKKLSPTNLSEDDYYHICWNIGYILKMKVGIVNSSYQTKGEDMADLAIAMFKCSGKKETIVRNLHDKEKGSIQLLDMIDPDQYPEAIEKLQQMGINVKYKYSK